MMPGVRVVHVTMLAVRAVRERAGVAAIGTIAASVIHRGAPCHVRQSPLKRMRSGQQQAGYRPGTDSPSASGRDARVRRKRLSGAVPEPSRKHRPCRFVQSVTPRFRETLRWLAANRKAYHVVDDAELAKASGTEHHGGVCFIKKRMGMPVAEWLQQAQSKDCVLALEDVSNPHNLGGIMRSCGVKGLLVNDASLLRGRSPHGRRWCTSGNQRRKLCCGSGSVPQSRLHHRDRPATLVRRWRTAASEMVLVLGQEREGLSTAHSSRAISACRLAVPATLKASTFRSRPASCSPNGGVRTHK